MAEATTTTTTTSPTSSTGIQPPTAQPVSPQPTIATKKKGGKGNLKAGLNFGQTYVLGSISACTAELVVYPMDMIKTRLQITGMQAETKTTSFGIIKNIIRQEGPSGFYLGFQAACYRHLIYSGTRYFAYELLREKVFQRNEDGSFPLWKSALAAMSAGAIGQFLASPTDLIKVQMQTEGFRVLKGEPRLYSGSIDCFASCFRQYGFFGMWRGWFPNVQRAAFVQLGDLAAYDLAKQKLLLYTSLQDNFLCHGCASIVAGLVSTIMSTPSDVLKTRIMSNPELYTSTTDCLVKTVKGEGFFALYKGFFPIWARMGPKAMVFYLTFEQLRGVLGLDSW